MTTDIDVNDIVNHFIKIKKSVFSGNQINRNAKDFFTFQLLENEIFFVKSIQFHESEYIRYILLTSDFTYADITCHDQRINEFLEVIEESS